VNVQQQSNFEEIEAPNESGFVTYPGSASFLSATWLADAVTAANSSDPFHLITVINAAATAFDQEHNNNKNYITSAADHAENFILWTWGVGAGRVTATKKNFNPTNPT
jgi:hypothetical protein